MRLTESAPASDFQAHGSSKNGFADKSNGRGSAHESHFHDNESSDSVPIHPLGLKPLGNQYIAAGPTARASMGTFAILPDETILVLLEYLDQYALRALGYACRFLYACCRSDDLWKQLFVETRPQSSHVRWLGSWRSTLLRLEKEQEARLDCGNVFSDVLHRPFVCSHVALSRFTNNIPKANQIARFEALTYEEFAEKWTETPFIVTKYIQSWPVSTQWTINDVLARHGEVVFRAEAVDWTFASYNDYMTDNQDESPLYLFDRKFAEKMGIRIGKEDGAAYWKPGFFGPDVFEILGKERPAHRWLIVGPERSGSTFHKDPNGTSAWNAVLQGAKYWIMFPPTASVPGVYVSQDNSEVTSPLSIAEWLLEFHAAARRLPDCVEGICGTGEILHVPSGWWHLVVNLESGIAITQNFVPRSPSLYHLTEVISFLRDKADQVTGFGREVADPYKLFVERLRETDPGLLEEALAALGKKAQKKRKWDEAVGGGEAEPTGGFSFGFGGDDDDIP